MRWGLCGVLVLCAAVLPRDASAEPGRWIELDAPSPRERIQGAPWVEIRGQARERTPDVPYDVVVALDLSTSSFRAAGFDVDGDGVTGEPLRGSLLYLSDPDDTIAEAGLALVKRFIDRVDPDRGRVAFVTFAGHASVRMPLAPPAAARQAVRKIQVFPRRDGTHLASAIQRGIQALGAESPPGAEAVPAALGPDAAWPPGTRVAPRSRPQQIILLVTDGHPTLPGSRDAAARYALRAASEAARSGVRLFGVSPSRAWGPISPALTQITRHAGGDTFRSDLPEEWLRRLEPSRPLQIHSARLRNGTTGQPGRAVRWFPDGSFDGYVELEPGLNLLEAHLDLGDGRTLDRELAVHYAPVAIPSGTRSLLRTLRVRTLETELAGQARTAQPPWRAVRVEPE